MPCEAAKVTPKPRQRRGAKGETEEQQRGARGEADHHADAIDLELPHPGDPDRQRDQREREHGEQPPAFEPVLTRRHVQLPLILPSLPAANAKRLRKGAKATKQSICPLCRAMDCFAALAMTRMQM
jgi:hypothetical protein